MSDGASSRMSKRLRMSEGAGSWVSLNQPRKRQPAATAAPGKPDGASSQGQRQGQGQGSLNCARMSEGASSQGSLNCARW